MPSYRFVVRHDPRVDLGPLARETGLRCVPMGGSRVRIEGDLVDRAALHGVLARVYALGVDLLEVQRVASPSPFVTAP